MTEEKVSNKQILQGIEIPVELCDDQVLIKPLPEIKVTKEITKVDDNSWEPTDNGEDGEDATADVKVETEEVPANFQLGVILTIDKSGGNPLPYEAGDTIVYTRNAGTYFDLFKDSMLLRRFDIKGKWLKDTNEI